LIGLSIDMCIHIIVMRLRLYVCILHIYPYVCTHINIYAHIYTDEYTYHKIESNVRREDQCRTLCGAYETMNLCIHTSYISICIHACIYAQIHILTYIYTIK
jgi:hypothetical protein